VRRKKRKPVMQPPAKFVFAKRLRLAGPARFAKIALALSGRLR
jgi:hypothetical protein